LAIPPIKLKLELHRRGELLIANQLDQSLWSILSRSQVQFITLSVGGAQLCCALYQALQAARIFAEKPISWAKLEHFDSFAINCSVWTHILNTVGDALSHFTLYSDLWWMWVS
jgi:hypothetical protein